MDNFELSSQGTLISISQIKEQLFCVEKIIGDKKNKGVRLFLVKWVGDDTPTWEPQENLLYIKEDIQQYLKKKKVSINTANKRQRKQQIKLQKIENKKKQKRLRTAPSEQSQQQYREQPSQTPANKQIEDKINIQIENAIQIKKSKVFPKQKLQQSEEQHFKPQIMEIKRINWFVIDTNQLKSCPVQFRTIFRREIQKYLKYDVEIEVNNQNQKSTENMLISSSTLRKYNPELIADFAEELILTSEIKRMKIGYNNKQKKVSQ